jgi:hypothetical protein
VSLIIKNSCKKPRLQSYDGFLALLYSKDYRRLTLGAMVGYDGFLALLYSKDYRRLTHPTGT